MRLGHVDVTTVGEKAAPIAIPLIWWNTKLENSKKLLFICSDKV